MNYIELLERFVILLLSVSIIFIFSNRKHKGILHPLLNLVSICTFFLCLIFAKIEISIGIGFGLFAIFSILRFRTESFSITTIVFLFVTITLSIVNVMFPFEKFTILIVFNAIIVFFFIGCNLLIVDNTSLFKNSLEIVFEADTFLKLTENEKHNFIATTLSKHDFEFSEKSVDFISNKIVIKVFY